MDKERKEKVLNNKTWEEVVNDLSVAEKEKERLRKLQIRKDDGIFTAELPDGQRAEVSFTTLNFQTPIMGWMDEKGKPRVIPIDGLPRELITGGTSAEKDQWGS